MAAATILEEKAGDAPQLPGLVKETAKTFTVKEVAADKAYGSQLNFETVDSVGGSLYVAFKKGTTGGIGGLFGKMYHYFAMNQEEYMQHYHRRSMVESTFSMVPTRFTLERMGSYLVNANLPSSRGCRNKSAKPLLCIAVDL